MSKRVVRHLMDVWNRGTDNDYAGCVNLFRHLINNKILSTAFVIFC